MNPDLEHPSLWAGIHHRLITAIANDLAPKLRPKYIVAIEERVYEVSGDPALLVGVPDVSVQSSLSLGRSTEPQKGDSTSGWYCLQSKISFPLTYY